MQTHSTKPSPKQARVAAQIAYVKGIESLKTSGGLTDADRRFLYSQRPSSIDAEGRIVLEFASPADVIAAGSSPSAVRFFFTHNQPEATEPKERDLYGRAAAKRSNQKKYRRKAASWPPHSDHDFASPDRRLGIRHAPLLPWFIMAAAEDLVRRLHARGFQPGRQADTARDDRIATVDLDTLDQEDSRSVGCERICLQALEELGFQELLRSLGASARDSRLAVALVVAKMINPASEREALRWLQDDSTTLELLALDGGTGLSLSKLYRINDLLWKHRQSLQQGLFLRERQLLDIPDTIVFYDLSNTFYTARPNDTLRRFGRSKQKRNDCPLVSLALLLDGAGFPRSCEILPGNISEPGTLQDAMGRLEAVCEDSSAKPTVIMDAGIATEENLTWLRQQHYNWICVSREGQPQPPEGVAELTRQQRRRSTALCSKRRQEDHRERHS